MRWHAPCCALSSRHERVSTLLQGVATSYFHLWLRRVSEDFTASRLPMPPPRSTHQVPPAGKHASKCQSLSKLRTRAIRESRAMRLVTLVARVEAPLQGMNLWGISGSRPRGRLVPP